MAATMNVRARYTKGILKLSRRLSLPEGAEVQVTVTPVEEKPKRRRSHKRAYRYPTRTVSWGSLKQLSGIVSLGGDALADSEALYNSD